MRVILIYSILFLISFKSIAQSNELKAKAKYFLAEESYNKAEYDKCLAYLEETETILGTTNTRILYLKIKTLFDKESYQQIYSEGLFDKYFSKAKENSAGYKEILKLVDEIDNKIDEQNRKIAEEKEKKRLLSEQLKKNAKEREEKIKKQCGLDFDEAIRLNTVEGYKKFLSKWAGNQYDELAFKYLNKAIANEKRKIQEEKRKIEEIRGTFTDPRDGKTYKTMKIGNQIWMAENLRYDIRGSRCYEKNPNYCFKYGRLYSWESAAEACPPGWHIPSNQEWEMLIYHVRGSHTKMYQMITKSGLTFQEGGYRNEYGDYVKRYIGGWYWSSTQNAVKIRIAWDYCGEVGSIMRKKALLSIRCVKDSP